VIMRKIVSVDPFQCRLWRLHDRLDETVTAESCRGEIESFLQHGQLVPVLGRKLRDGSSHKIELVYGARRLFVARHLNLPLRVELREISDRQAVIAMDIENRQRADLSAYERGMSYCKWLESGHFSSQDDVARALKISSSQVSRLVAVARLPPLIVEAFVDPAEICEGWGRSLLELLEDTRFASLIFRRAAEVRLMSPRARGADVYRMLIASIPANYLKRSRQVDEVMRDSDGVAIFRMQHQANGLAIRIPLKRLSRNALDEIRAALVTVIEN
jgi:ParB/RepB/Spo0J family partition protein